MKCHEVSRIVYTSILNAEMVDSSDSLLARRHVSEYCDSTTGSSANQIFVMSLDFADDDILSRTNSTL